MEPTCPSVVEFRRVILGLTNKVFHVRDFVDSIDPIFYRRGGSGSPKEWDTEIGGIYKVKCERFFIGT